MPEIFEAFGYALTDQSSDAKASRVKAHCPFMGTDCDGGGNRSQSNIRLASRPSLAVKYPHRHEIPAGVCSITTGEASPWVVCPRRLLVLGRAGSSRAHQGHVEDFLVGLTGHPPQTEIGIWREVKFKLKAEKTFDYTFDYIAMPVGVRSLDDAAADCGLDAPELQSLATKAGYDIEPQSPSLKRFPYGSPTLIEIMTSSTSGSNKSKEKTIADSLEKALLGVSHVAPGINKRQVWARMVSQLIVKSEVGLRWGGKTIWILQDNLVDYIAQTTGLHLEAFKTDETSEVNIISLGFGKMHLTQTGVRELSDLALFAGPISGTKSETPAFVDIIRTPYVPPLTTLFYALAKKGPADEVLTV